MPSASGCTRSVTETIEACCRIEVFHHETMQFSKPSRIVFRQFAADEDEAALARLAVLPFRWWLPSSIMWTPWKT